MSINSALLAGVSGLIANSSALAAISVAKRNCPGDADDNATRTPI